MIDAHVHNWDLGVFRYPWLDADEFMALRSNYLPEDYRNDVGTVESDGVEGWVHIQAEVDHSGDPVAETAWVAGLAADARQCGAMGPVACVAYADLRADDIDEILTRHCAYPLTRGIRQEVWWDAGSRRADISNQNLLADPRWRAGYGALADHDLTFDLVAWPSQLLDVAAIAASEPAIPLVFDHFGMPELDSAGGLETWRTGMTQLAQLPHAFVKLSAVSVLAFPRDERLVRTVVGELLEVFGPQRCMTGSNFPVERQAGGFAEVHRMMLASLDELSDADRADVLTGTAKRFYRIAT